MSKETIRIVGDNKITYLRYADIKSVVLSTPSGNSCCTITITCKKDQMFEFQIWHNTDAAKNLAKEIGEKWEEYLSNRAKIKIEAQEAKKAQEADNEPSVNPILSLG